MNDVRVLYCSNALFFSFFGLGTLLDEKEQPMYSHIMQVKFFELIINNNLQIMKICIHLNFNDQFLFIYF